MPVAETIDSYTTKEVSKPSASPRTLSPDLLRGLSIVLQGIVHMSFDRYYSEHGAENSLQDFIKITLDSPILEPFGGESRVKWT